jgi:threonine dehydratase
VECLARGERTGGAAAFAALLSGKYVAKPGEKITVLLCGANTAAASF